MLLKRIHFLLVENFHEVYFEVTNTVKKSGVFHMIVKYSIIEIKLRSLVSQAEKSK